MPVVFYKIVFGREEEGFRNKRLIVQGSRYDDSALQFSYYCPQVGCLEWVEGNRLSALSGGFGATESFQILRRGLDVAFGRSSSSSRLEEFTHQPLRPLEIP